MREFWRLHVELLQHDAQPARTQYISEIKSTLEETDAVLEPHYDLIVRSLDSVSHLSEHEDDKASRRLTAMAFLSTAATGFAAFALTASSAANLRLFQQFGPGLLIAYYAFCAIGGLLSVYAMLPHYNIAKPRGEAPTSLMFAPMIDRVSGQQWVRPFVENEKSQLQEHVARQHLAEIKLIAQTTVWKMKMHTLAGGHFLLALCVFFLMIVSFAAEKMSSVQPRPHSSPIAANSPASVVMVFDGDNTLWDTDAVYRNAQLGLLADVESIADQGATGDRLDFLRRYDQEIAKNDPNRNRYPAIKLARRLYAELRKVKDPQSSGEPDEATLGKLEVAVTGYTQRLLELPKVFPRVKETLELCASKNAKIILLTENSQQRAEHLLGAHQLRPLFHRVQAERNKAGSFKTIRDELEPTLAGRCVFVSVGDQRSSDLLPASAAGYRTVFIPGGFTILQEDMGGFQPDFTFLTIGEFSAAYDQVIGVRK